MNSDLYKAVVRLTNTSSLGGGSSLGSGVIISPAGLVITNNHVIEDASFGTAFGDMWSRLYRQSIALPPRQDPPSW